MKILILQLARFGDIFLTLPTLRALRRRYPAAELHVLVRDRFSAALGEIEFVDKMWTLPTAKILSAIVENEDWEQSLRQMGEWTDLIREQDFDLIINLSFSPFSSYLTHTLAHYGASVRGYTRHSDGFLSLPDDPSAYFYAQIGIDRENRFHLAEVFAAVADVELAPEDWQAPASWQGETHYANHIVVHMGASTANKTLMAEQWHEVIYELEKVAHGPIILIGSKEERSIAAQISTAIKSDKLVNLVGQTTFAETAQILRTALLLVGGDSAPIHIAGLVGTRCLNLSFASVNFWETGPRAVGSRVLLLTENTDISAKYVVRHIMACVAEAEAPGPYLSRTASLPIGYEPVGMTLDNFSWQLIEAIYCAEEWPVLPTAVAEMAVRRLYEAVALGAEQIPRLHNVRTRNVANEILSQVDEMVSMIEKMCPVVRPLIAWFNTERVRLGPLSVSELSKKTEDIYLKMLAVLSVYYKGLHDSQGANP